MSEEKDIGENTSVRLGFVIGGLITFAMVIWWAATISAKQTELSKMMSEYQGTTVKRLSDIETLIQSKSSLDSDLVSRVMALEKFGSNPALVRISDVQKELSTLRKEFDVHVIQGHQQSLPNPLR